jgi:hypothetical protein
MYTYIYVSICSFQVHVLFLRHWGWYQMTKRKKQVGCGLRGICIWFFFEYPHINTKRSLYWKTVREADAITTSRFTSTVIRETASSHQISTSVHVFWVWWSYYSWYRSDSRLWNTQPGDSESQRHSCRQASRSCWTWSSSSPPCSSRHTPSMRPWSLGCLFAHRNVYRCVCIYIFTLCGACRSLSF